MPAHRLPRRKCFTAVSAGDTLSCRIDYGFARRLSLKVALEKCRRPELFPTSDTKFFTDFHLCICLCIAPSDCVSVCVLPLPIVYLCLPTVFKLCIYLLFEASVGIFTHNMSFCKTGLWWRQNHILYICYPSGPSQIGYTVSDLGRGGGGSRLRRPVRSGQKKFIRLRHWSCKIGNFIVVAL